MKSSAPNQFFLRLLREAGRIYGLELYENVYIEVTDSFKIRFDATSKAFHLVLDRTGSLSIKSIPVEPKTFKNFPWYDEKFVLGDSSDVLEKATEMNAPASCLNWLASRL